MPVNVAGRPERTRYGNDPWHLGLYVCFVNHGTARLYGWGDAQKVTITYDDGKPRKRVRRVR